MTEYRIRFSPKKAHWIVELSSYFLGMRVWTRIRKAEFQSYDGALRYCEQVGLSEVYTMQIQQTQPQTYQLVPVQH